MSPLGDSFLVAEQLVRVAAALSPAGANLKGTVPFKGALTAPDELDAALEQAGDAGGVREVVDLAAGGEAGGHRRPPR